MLNIRKAVPADAPAIAGFQVSMALETEQLILDKPTVIKGVEALFTDPSKGNYYVAESDEGVVASLLITYEWSDWRNGTVIWIQSVYVIPGYRRRGVYSKLYSHVKQMVLDDKNLKGIRLYADKMNHSAQKAYKKLGMNADHYITFEWLK